jgi:transcription elongation factor GreA
VDAVRESRRRVAERPQGNHRSVDSPPRPVVPSRANPEEAAMVTDRASRDRRNVLTMEGKRLLEERAARLRDEVLPEIVTRLEETDRDVVVEAEYERTTGELAHVEYLLRHAAVAEDVPGDPQVIEIGDQVTVRLDDGTTETYLVVHPVEAALDDVRISAESPLARAVLGRRVGEEVRVEAPAGPYRCRIVAAELLDESGSRVVRESEPG